MGKTTGIEWCDHTFNGWWGCAEISPGCDNCYARTFAARFGVKWGVDEPRREFGDKHWNEPLRWDMVAAREGRHARVFCASMADVFDKNAPHGARARLWKLIADTPNLDWLLLTKRIGNVMRMLPADWGDGYANVWLGISVVNQEEADRDIPKLLTLPARVRFLSCEPLLGPIDLTAIRRTQADGFMRPLDGRFNKIGWVISGGESGPKARPSHPDWHRSLRDQCAAAGVAYLFKQWGAWVPLVDRDRDDPDWRAEYTLTDRKPDTHEILNLAGGRGFHGERVHMMKRVGKKAAGRMLDGITHDGFPT